MESADPPLELPGVSISLVLVDSSHKAGLKLTLGVTVPGILHRPLEPGWNFPFMTWKFRWNIFQFILCPLSSDSWTVTGFPGSVLICLIAELFIELFMERRDECFAACVTRA